MKRKSNRRRRLLAWLIDLVILFPLCVLVAGISRLPFLGGFSMLLVTIDAVAYFVVFILRDYLFCGRSIGKRICKLKVVDAGTLAEPSAKQLVVKNLFLFLGLFDGLFLIISGRSLGECATLTVVLHDEQLPATESDYAKTQSKGNTERRVIIAAVAILCISVFMFSIITIALNAVKKQDNYKVAYTYLLNSTAYAELRADETQITLTGYSSGVRPKGESSAPSTAVFTFLVKGHLFEAVCHKNSDVWYVCSECTDFQ